MIETETERQRDRERTRSKSRSRRRRRSGRSSTWLCHRCCTLQVASCQLRFERRRIRCAFNAKKSQRKRNTVTGGAGTGAGWMRGGDGRGKGLAVRTGNLLHNKLVQCAITRCRDSLPRLPQGCSATLSEQQQEQQAGACSMQHGACSRANIFESAACCGWRCRRKICGQQNGNGCGALAYAALCSKKRQVPRVARVAKVPGTRYQVSVAPHSPLARSHIAAHFINSSWNEAGS